MTPAIGDLVHFRESPAEDVQAAIIVKVGGDDECSLVLFRDGSNDTQQPWAGVESAQWRTGVKRAGKDVDGPAWEPIGDKEEAINERAKR